MPVRNIFLENNNVNPEYFEASAPNRFELPSFHSHESGNSEVEVTSSRGYALTLDDIDSEGPGLLVSAEKPSPTRTRLPHLLRRQWASVRIRNEAFTMPIEAILPLVVFGVMLVLWIVLPSRAGENDLGDKIRSLLIGRKRNL